MDAAHRGDPLSRRQAGRQSRSARASSRRCARATTVSTYEGEVTEYQPGKLLGVLLRPQAFAIHVVYHVEGDEDWTRLDYGCDVKPTTWRGY